MKNLNKRFCKTNKTQWMPGTSDLKRFFKYCLTDEEIAEKYCKTELISLLRYNWDRITDNRNKN